MFAELPEPQEAPFWRALCARALELVTAARGRGADTTQMELRISPAYASWAMGPTIPAGIMVLGVPLIVDDRVPEDRMYLVWRPTLDVPPIHGLEPLERADRGDGRPPYVEGFDELVGGPLRFLDAVGDRIIRNHEQEGGPPGANQQP